MYNLVLFLPFPPTINHYYVSGHRRQRFISAAGSRFRTEVGKSLEENNAINLKLDIRLNVEVILYPPDKRIRDLDNYMKALLDALTHGGLWTDDSLIDQLVIYRGQQVRGGAAKLEINPAGPVLPF